MFPISKPLTDDPPRPHHDLHGLRLLRHVQRAHLQVAAPPHRPRGWILLQQGTVKTFQISRQIFKLLPKTEKSEISLSPTLGVHGVCAAVDTGPAGGDLPAASAVRVPDGVPRAARHRNTDRNLVISLLHMGRFTRRHILFVKFASEFVL